jgi:hypothetical protein
VGPFQSSPAASGSAPQRAKNGRQNRIDLGGVDAEVVQFLLHQESCAWDLSDPARWRQPERGHDLVARGGGFLCSASRCAPEVPGPRREPPA